METVASEVFQRTKLTTIWVSCSIAGGNVPQSAACQEASSPVMVSLTLINNFPVLAHILDASTPCAGRATLYYDRVRALSLRSGGTVTVGQVLGYAAAHEIGHLMLGSRGHSIKGVMKETWSPSDLREMAVHEFWFAGELNQTHKASRILLSRSNSPR
jgi:hypothetical protein